MKKNARAKRTKLLILLLHMQMFDVHVAGLLELPIHWRQMKKKKPLRSPLAYGAPYIDLCYARVKF